MIGEIMEVVIPVKRDKRDKRFGFARFDRVADPRKFEYDLDNIIIGRDKISVNLSRFHQPTETERKKMNGIPLPAEDRSRAKTGIGRNKDSHHRQKEDGSYAQAVKQGGLVHQNEGQKHVVLSYEAEKEELLRLEKAFVGIVEHPGMTYNIQNVFHSQGYFGVKVTPLGSHLALLEGQEDGEVQALMEDAKDWLDQWFREIRP
ncbi:hypothetical protein A2U01_0001046 [Trifolium medium]|uniref:RRM domain-containing protein n=1 Tax=Trifolium medium TaxID=97028 RepID=A0A392LZ42_9FABA|nr:hypothetical protein [Trifolium medium]